MNDTLPRPGRSKKDILPLTGLRGVAALVVVFYHYNIFTVPKGYLAVDLFFVLSGFVMALTYGESMAPGRAGAAYLPFLGKRFARVYPIYLLFTVVTFILPEAGRPTLVQLGVNVLLIQQFGLDLVSPSLGTSIVGQGWSISAEMGAYVVFPLLARVLFMRSRPAVAVAGAGALAVIVALALAPPSNPHQAGPLDHHWHLLGIARCLAEFTGGVVVFRLWRDLEQKGLQVPRWSALLALVAIGLLSRHAHGDPFIVLLLAVLVLDAAQMRSLVARWLQRRPCVLLGEWSYSLYLLHILPFFYVRPFTDWTCAAFHVPHARAASLLLLIGFDLLLAAVCFRFVEKPSRALMRALLGGEPGFIVLEPAAP